MSERPAYRVEVFRAERWWVITAPTLPGVHSQARALTDVEPMAREAIALWLSETGAEVGEHDFDIDVHVVDPTFISIL